MGKFNEISNYFKLYSEFRKKIEDLPINRSIITVIVKITYREQNPGSMKQLTENSYMKQLRKNLVRFEKDIIFHSNLFY